MRATVNSSIEAFSACLVAMPTCDVATLAATQSGDLLARNSARVEEWNLNGYTVRDRDTAFRYVIDSVTVAPDGTSASVLVCIADGSKLVIPSAAPDGSDIIVDEVFISGRDEWKLRLEPDGVWRAYDAPSAGPTESQDVCPAA